MFYSQVSFAESVLVVVRFCFGARPIPLIAIFGVALLAGCVSPDLSEHDPSSAGVVWEYEWSPKTGSARPDAYHEEVRAWADKIGSYVPSDDVIAACGEIQVPHELLDRDLVRPAIFVMTDQCSGRQGEVDRILAESDDPVREFHERYPEAERRNVALRAVVEDLQPSTVVEAELMVQFSWELSAAEGRLRGAAKFVKNASEELSLSSAWLNLLAAEGRPLLVMELVDHLFDENGLCAFTGPDDLHVIVQERMQRAAESIVAYEGKNLDPPQAKNWLTYAGRELQSWTIPGIEKAGEERRNPSLVAHEEHSFVNEEYAQILATEGPLRLPNLTTANAMMHHALTAEDRSVTRDWFYWFIQSNEFDELSWQFQHGKALQLRALEVYPHLFSERFSCTDTASDGA